MKEKIEKKFAGVVVCGEVDIFLLNYSSSIWDQRWDESFISYAETITGVSCKNTECADGCPLIAAHL